MAYSKKSGSNWKEIADIDCSVDITGMWNDIAPGNSRAESIAKHSTAENEPTDVYTYTGTPLVDRHKGENNYGPGNPNSRRANSWGPK